MAISKIVYKSSASATPVTWMDATSATATAADIISPKTAMLADGVVTEGTGTGGGGSWVTVYNGTVALAGDWGNGYYYQMINPWNDTIAANSAWRITWDNVQYTCTATWEGSQDGNPYAIGNYTYDGGTGGTDCPFFMQMYFGTSLAVVGASGTHTVKIEKQGASAITGTFTAPSTGSSYTLEFGAVLSGYLFKIEMDDASKTSLMASGQTAARAYAFIGGYPASPINNTTPTNNYMGYRVNPSTSETSVSVTSGFSDGRTASSLKFGIGAFSSGAMNLYYGMTYKYTICPIT